MAQDTYSKWEDEGSLDERIATIKELVSKRITQKEIAKTMGISERVLIKLKKEHPRIKNAFIFGFKELKDRLVNAIYERAIGVTTDRKTTTFEETPNGQKKKITRIEKQHPPDFHSARYLLITTFGKEFNEKKEELELMYKKYADKDEKWSSK